MTLPSDIRIGIIGGSGFYQIAGFAQTDEIMIATPFGNPSDTYMIGELNHTRVAFLPRHGREHRLLPSELNYRANIYGFKQLGVTHLLAITAVGSLQEHISPLDIVIPDQLIDRTSKRESSFFGNGIAAHIPFADPFCPDLSALLFKTASSVTDRVHKGGTLITIEGPAFSTRAESRLYRQWGIDIIGMTTLQEAKLAREAEICFSAMAMVTDYDCWREASDDVLVETVVENLNKNSAHARAIIEKVLPLIPEKRPCSCQNSLAGAVMTHLPAIDKKTGKRLQVILEKYISL